MRENRLKTYERILGYILILAIILGVISSLTGCDALEEESRIVIDYRFTEAHEEERVGHKNNPTTIVSKWL